MTPKTNRAILMGLMNLVIIVALVLVARIVVEFFGSASATAPGNAVVELTDHLVPDLGIRSITTPYGGVFDGGATVIAVVLLFIDWALSMARRHV